MCLGETCITKFPILTEQMFGRLSLEEFKTKHVNSDL